MWYAAEKTLSLNGESTMMSDRKWTFGLIALLVVFLYLLVQFGLISFKIQHIVGNIEQPPAAAAKGPHFVMISQELDNPFWRTVERGAREVAQNLGMQMEYVGPLRIDVKEQTRLMEKTIAEKPDAILAQGIRSDQFNALVAKAMRQGIPVITVDTDAPGSERLTYVGTDNLESGKLLGRTLVQAAGTKGHIGVIIGSDTADNQRLRLQGFREVIGQYPDLKIVDVRPSNISRIIAAEQAEEMLLSHPDIDFMVGLSALDGIGIVQAVHSASPQKPVQIFGFDDLEETKQAIKRGEIVATVIQRPYLMGVDSVTLLHDYLQKRPVPKEHYTDILVLDKSNVSLE